MTSAEGWEMKDVLDNKMSFSSIYIEVMFFSALQYPHKVSFQMG